MIDKVFINLPVNHLETSMDFFRKIGFDFNLKFTDEKAACMVISEHIYVMLLCVPFFESFTHKNTVDAVKSSECTIALAADRREDVDILVNKAIEAGAIAHGELVDHGFMYTWGFQDLDGHLWEVMYMSPESYT